MTNLANGLPLHADRYPLRVDEGGAVRVGNSRISLDLIVEQYENGMTPEELVCASAIVQPGRVSPWAACSVCAFVQWLLFKDAVARE
jgi:hypothetical protein